MAPRQALGGHGVITGTTRTAQLWSHGRKSRLLQPCPAAGRRVQRLCIRRLRTDWDYPDISTLNFARASNRPCRRTSTSISHVPGRLI